MSDREKSKTDKGESEKVMVQHKTRYKAGKTRYTTDQTSKDGLEQIKKVKATSRKDKAQDKTLYTKKDKEKSRTIKERTGSRTDTRQVGKSMYRVKTRDKVHSKLYEWE